MKKTLIALTVLLSSAVLATAQQKSPEALRNAVVKAEAAAENPKKAEKPDTWMKIGKAYMDAYNGPAGQLWIGATQAEIQLVAGNVQPVSTETVKLGDALYQKQVYADKNLYFNQQGQLVLIEVTKPVFEDALGEALGAYARAGELDVAGKKTKAIVAALEDISSKYLNEGMNDYTLGDFAKSSIDFENAANAAATTPCNRLDTTAVYNAGFTAWFYADNLSKTDSLAAVPYYERARMFFETCYNHGYHYENGEVFAKLHDIYNHLGQKDAARSIIEEGFAEYPDSQSILISLINFYTENNEDPEKLFDIINLAIQNEPNNASLYYVMGNVYKQLGKQQEAKEAYYKCNEINPDYAFGFIGAGIMLYEDAVSISEAASNEMDDRKYEELVAKFEQCLKDAIDPFEKAYAVSKDEEVRNNIALYLKNIYYRFVTQGPEYEANYKKYDEIVKNSQQ